MDKEPENRERMQGENMLKTKGALVKRKILLGLLSLLLLIILQPGTAQAKVRLSRKTAVMTTGTKLKLRVKGTNKKAVWKSTDRNVAAVSGKGLVRAKKTGKAKIIAAVGGKKYMCAVTVLSNEFWGITSHEDAAMSSPGVAYFVSKLSYSDGNLVCEGFFRNTTQIDIPAGTAYTITVSDEKNRILGTGSFKTAGVIKSNGCFDEKIVFTAGQQKAAGADLRKIADAGADVEMTVVQTEITESKEDAAK